MTASRELGAALGQLRAARERPVPSAIAIALAIVGIGIAIAGGAIGALPIAAGMWVSGWVDRRLPVLAAIALLPTLTLFHPLVLATVGQAVLDFRLLLTAGTGLAVGFWVVVRPQRPDLVGSLLLGFLALLTVLTLVNDVSPLHALPVLGRWGTFTVVYLAARRWLGDRDGTWLVISAIVVAMIIPAVSGLIQTIAGDALLINEAARLSGVYATSPVGLGLAMQLAGLAVAAVVGLWDGPIDRGHRLAVVLIILFTVVLVGTATRLVFASYVIGLVLTAALAHRYRAVPFIIVAAALVLLVQPDLAGRFASTVEPLPTIPPFLEPGQSLPPIDPDAGDASLRFRLYVWGAMLPEWASSPLVGQGTGSFATLFEQRSGLERVAPHNDYLGIAVETGLLGLATYVALQTAVIVTLVQRIRRRRPDPPRLDELVTLVAFVSLGVINAINNPMLFLDLQVALWALVGSTLGRSETSDGAQPGLPRTEPARAALNAGSAFRSR